MARKGAISILALAAVMLSAWFVLTALRFGRVDVALVGAGVLLLAFLVLRSTR